MLNSKLIFVDTEFSTLDPYKGEILSIGMIKDSGEELYLELECDAPCNDWVKKNILPTLTGEKISREVVKQKIAEFVGSGKPILVGFVNQFDTIYIYKLFGSPDTPFFWVPLDFASMLFDRGYDPKDYMGKGKIFKELGIDNKKYKLHHAIDDAKLHRDTFVALRFKDNFKALDYPI